MLLEIITPEKNVFEGEVSSVTLPGVSGEFAILNNHAPIVASLQSGKIRIVDSSNKKEEFAINSGVVEMKSNKIIVLAD